MAATALVLGAGPAAAAAPPEYNSIPATLPGNVVSVAFEANGLVEFGDYISLAGTERSSDNIPVTIIMSSWACESDATVGGDCITTPGDTWKQSLKLTIYNVDKTNPVLPAAGAVVLTTTQDFNIPYRPSLDPIKCPSTQKWAASNGTCYNGFAFPVTFFLPVGKTLPDELIWGLAFNTGDYGNPKVGKPGPYNSLNVGAHTFAPAPFAGVDPEPDSAFERADGGAFLDTAGYAAYRPMACFGSTCPFVASAPVSSVLGETGAPVSSVLGETGAPVATPPPTSTGDPSGNHPGPGAALLVCSAFAAMALFVVMAQRRSIRR